MGHEEYMDSLRQARAPSFDVYHPHKQRRLDHHHHRHDPNNGMHACRSWRNQVSLIDPRMSPYLNSNTTFPGYQAGPFGFDLPLNAAIHFHEHLPSYLQHTAGFIKSDL